MDPMKFSEMSYTRPDIDALLGQCKALAAKAAGAASGEELAKLKTVGDIYNYITAHI